MGLYLIFVISNLTTYIECVRQMNHTHVITIYHLGKYGKFDCIYVCGCLFDVLINYFLCRWEFGGTALDRSKGNKRNWQVWWNCDKP